MTSTDVLTAPRTVCIGAVSADDYIPVMPPSAVKMLPVT